MSRVALKRVAKITAGQSPPSSEVGDFDGEGAPFIQGNAEFGDLYPTPVYRCDSAPKRCSELDILLSVRAPVGALNIADRSYGIGRGLCAIEAKPGTDRRFLWWMLNSLGQELERVGTGSTYMAVTAEDVGSLQISDIGESKQRAIADYLDAETARIDALIEKKRSLRRLLKEQLAAHIEHVVWDGVQGTIPLMHLTPSNRQIMYGIVLPGPDIEDGVPIVKGGNVASGKLEPHQLARTTYEIEANYVRSRIAGGDVLYAIRGGIGDVEIASASISGANLTQDVARVAPRAGVDSRWIRYALESATARADALGRVVGATVRGINIGDLKRVQMPDIDSTVMRAQADKLSRIEQSIKKIRQRLDQQTQLLTEHRQALITATVTGELEVPGAASSRGSGR